MARRNKICCAIFALVVATATGANAEDGGAWSVLGDGALENASGVIGVNQAAGDANAQLNATAIGVGTSSLANVTATQSLGVQLSGGTGPLSVRIEGGAFANASGIVGVNQASGFANAQINSVAIASGSGVEVADAELAQTVSVGYDSEASADAVAQGQREAIIDPGSFANARGVVQVNQAAGIGNATINSLNMRVGAGGG